MLVILFLNQREPREADSVGPIKAMLLHAE